MYAYVGCRTTRERNARGQGIAVFAVHAGGEFEPVQLLQDLVNPSYLAMSADGRHLYAVHGDGHEVSAFVIDPANGRLTLLNRQDIGGRNPVHLALDTTGRHLVVTDHLGAGVVVLPVGRDGALDPVSQRVTIDGPVGPHRVEQQQPKPHCNAFDPSGRWVLVPDKGTDRVHVLRFDGGQLQAVSVARAREAAGPRHAVFHPRGDTAYVVNELDSSITAYRFDANTGTLTPWMWRPTLPADFTGDSRAAAIDIDAAGRCLYVSNRGHDSLALFTLDEEGAPQLVQAVASGGRTPRAFARSPDGLHLFALNEDSDSIVPFAVDPASGLLRRAGTPTGTGSPTCLVFSPASL